MRTGEGLTVGSSFGISLLCAHASRSVAATVSTSSPPMAMGPQKMGVPLTLCSQGGEGGAGGGRGGGVGGLRGEMGRKWTGEG